MSAQIPADFVELFEKPITVVLATKMADGSMQLNPVWCGFDGEHILVNSAKGRVKDRNMTARPQVTVLALNPENPYHWCEVRGEVVEVTEEGAEELIDDLSEQYIKTRPYPWRTPTEVRLVYKIKPTRVNSFKAG